MISGQKRIFILCRMYVKIEEIFVEIHHYKMSAREYNWQYAYLRGVPYSLPDQLLYNYIKYVGPTNGTHPVVIIWSSR